jgi:7-keto-8-aminopelargonate synthetase-like enzyme
MQPGEFYQSLAIDKSPLEALGFNPYYLPLGGLRHGRPQVEGETYFDLASNDYLGLASDQRIHGAMIEAIREYGASMCGTPIATGYARILAELELQLARFTGLEAALVFPSCYQANVALFSCIATPQDVILVDHYAHASLGQGIKAVGCKVKPFLHNDMEHLERHLAAAAGFRQIFVVTESVFSTEGSLAPLGVIVELCGRYKAIPVVDDSHGIGVLGKTGRGILEEKDIADYPGIYTASLGKALGNAGGMIAGKHLLVDALRYSCPGLIYSTALPPGCAGGVLCAIEIIRREFGRIGATMWQNHRHLLETLRRRGFDLRSGPAPIAAIHGESAEHTIALARQFFNHRILTTPFVPPSVPDGKGTLRLILGAKLDDGGVKELMRAMDRLSPPDSTPARVNIEGSRLPAGAVATAPDLQGPRDFPELRLCES